MDEIQMKPLELNKQQFEELQKSVTKAVSRRWLRTKDLPNYLSMADSTIREVLPRLPFHPVGTIKLYDPNEIDEYIKNLN